jgi:hypothetical protein
LITQTERRESWMNTTTAYERRILNKLNKLGPRVALASLLLLPGAAWAGGVVTTCTEAALRAAMAGGGTVTFACDGTITLSNTITISADTLLDGTGHEITLSGGGSVRVLSNRPGITLTLFSLSIAYGMSTADGGGVYVAGVLNATNCTFRDNSTLAGLGMSGYGGAVYNSGTFNASQCAFLRNRTVGGVGAYGSDGSPAAAPGAGGDGGAGYGGAIYNAGLAVIDRSLFATNLAAGGAGGTGGNGTVVVGGYSNQTGGPGGDGGYGEGGALFNVSTASVVNCTFAGNVMSGGSGGQGGWAGMYTWNPHGTAYGFPGGGGGYGVPGGFTVCQSGGFIYLGNCTVACNSSVGGTGGAGGSGSLGNPNGPTGPSGQAHPAGIGGSASLVNSLLATNSPGGNGWAGLIDLGHNLSSDATCAFTNTGSFNGTDPKLGPLADNGGATLSMALLPGSPAIDAADPAAAPATDQRGIPRPVGSAPDIGAFEYGLPAILRISGSQATGLDILASAYPGLSCRLLSSSGSSSWVPIATNQVGANGTVLFHGDCAPGTACLFYRVVIP